MSNAASTIPAKRNVFRTKTTKIPSLDDYKPKKESKAKKKSVTTNADVLIVKHKENKRTHTNTGDGSDVHHFDDEETWMTKTKDALDSGIDKINTSTVGNAKHRKGIKQSAGHSSLSQPNKPSIKILHVQQYEQFMEERKYMLELNEKYEKRIAELEQETARVLSEFAELYEDNERLRRKMDTGDEPLLEPYSRVFEDRRILRDAESGYKKRIIRLEQEIIEKQKEIDMCQDKVKSLQAKITPTSQAEERERKTKNVQVQVELKKLKTENERLKNNVKELERLSNKSEVKSLMTDDESLRSTVTELEIKYSNKRDIGIKSTNKRDINVQSTNKRDINVQRTNRRNSHAKNTHKTDNTVKNTRITWNIPEQAEESKPERVKFDYEYLLPDSQVYD